MARRGDGIYLRGNTWWLDFRHDGARHVARLGKGITKSVAREIATTKRGKILTGEAGIGKKRKDIPLEKAIEDFLAWAKTNKRERTYKSYTYSLDEIKKSFEGKRLSDISSFLVEKHKHRRAGEDCRVASNRELAALKRLYSKAIEWKHFDGENPVKGVKMFAEPKGRVRYLEPEEEAALLAEMAEPLRTITLVGIYTGLRVKSEALTLRWRSVDLKRRLVTVEAAYAKNGETRSVDLNSTVREALERMKKDAPDDEVRDKYVFAKLDGSPYRSIRTAFQSACTRAKLIDVTPHTLRHTFASRLVMAGVDLRTIQELGGWSNLEMVQRYSHLSPGHKAEAVEKIVPNFTTLFTTLEKEQVAASGVSA